MTSPYNSTVIQPSVEFVVSPVMLAANKANVNSGSLPFSALNIAYIVTGGIGIACNLFAIIILVLHDPLRKRLPNYFFINQSALDLVVGALQIIISILTSVNTSGLLLYVWCYAINSKVFFTGLLMASTWNLVVMSMERYLEIVHPIAHKMWLTRRRVFAAMISVWVLGVVYKCLGVLPVMKVVNGVCKSGQYANGAAATVGSLYNVIGEFLFPFCIITVCYVKISRATRKVNFSAAGPQMTRVRRNIFKILTIFIVCFVLCAGPKQIFLILYSTGGVSVDFTGPLYTGCVFLNYLICCINPFIFLFKYEDFQRGVKTIVCRTKASVVTAGTNEINHIGMHNLELTVKSKQLAVGKITQHQA
jgi:7 transmembrane receptor (rhodopsin family)